MARTREKQVGRLGVKRGERYALIPEEIMRSAPYAAVPDWAKVALFALACQYNGRNNGNLSLPFSEAKSLGVANQWKTYAGLQVLERADLVVCTRRGKLDRGIKLANLFALTWRGIDETGTAYDHGIAVCPLPSHAWAKWAKPESWDGQVQEVTRRLRGKSTPPPGKRIPDTTPSGAARSTPSGAGNRPIDPPPRVLEGTSIAPPPRVPSEIWGGGPTDSAPRSRARTPSRARTLVAPPTNGNWTEKVLKLHRAQPHLTAADIARTFRVGEVDSTTVAQILAAQEASQ